MQLCKRLVPSRLHELHESGSQPFTWVVWVKICVCFTYRIYPFETFEFFCSCIRSQYRRTPAGVIGRHSCRGRVMACSSAEVGIRLCAVHQYSEASLGAKHHHCVLPKMWPVRYSKLVILSGKICMDGFTWTTVEHFIFRHFLYRCICAYNRPVSPLQDITNDVVLYYNNVM